MANISTYPIITPKAGDLLVGSETYDPQAADPTIGNPTRNFTIGSIATLVAADIPAGEQGPVGPAGSPGLPGTNGTNGVDGADGAQGLQGAPGNNGADGAPGATGPAGPQGSIGPTGSQGVPGADGTSIEIQGTVSTVNDLPATGNTVGDLWIVDQTGGGATAGDGYVWTANSVWLNIGPLRGPQGVQGIQGIQGIQGTAGVDGQNGQKGDKGDQGIQGPQGTQGETGPPGANGSNGATGPQGPQGIQGPAGPVSSVNAATGDITVSGYSGSNIQVQTVNSDVRISAPDAVVNTYDTYTSTPKVTNIISLTQAEYDAYPVLPPNTLFIII